jgi:hypothetical protein
MNNEGNLAPVPLPSHPSKTSISYLQRRRRGRKRDNKKLIDSHRLTSDLKIGNRIESPLPIPI